MIEMATVEVPTRPPSRPIHNLTILPPPSPLFAFPPLLPPAPLSRPGLLGVFGKPLETYLDVGGVFTADAVAAHLAPRHPAQLHAVNHLPNRVPRSSLLLSLAPAFPFRHLTQSYVQSETIHSFFGGCCVFIFV